MEEPEPGIDLSDGNDPVWDKADVAENLIDKIARDYILSLGKPKGNWTKPKGPVAKRRAALL